MNLRTALTVTATTAILAAMAHFGVSADPARRIIVTYTPGTTKQMISDSARAIDARVIDEFDLINGVTLELSAGANIAQALTAIAAAPGVDTAEPDGIVTAN